MWSPYQIADHLFITSIGIEDRSPDLLLAVKGVGQSRADLFGRDRQVIGTLSRAVVYTAGPLKLILLTVS
jgi:hypothetical protein